MCWVCYKWLVLTHLLFLEPQPQPTPRSDYRQIPGVLRASHFRLASCAPWEVTRLSEGVGLLRERQPTAQGFAWTRQFGPASVSWAGGRPRQWRPCTRWHGAKQHSAREVSQPGTEGCPKVCSPADLRARCQLTGLGQACVESCSITKAFCSPQAFG